MKKLKYFFLLAYSCFLAINAFGQEKITANKITKITHTKKYTYNSIELFLPAIKPFWLKAIVTNANQKPTVFSNILHVNLLNFDEHIVASKLLKIENGAADSFFELQELAPLSPENI